MMATEHGYYVGDEHSSSRLVGRRKKADPLDHTYYVQSAGDTRRQVDPRLPVPTDTPRFRATCDVCPWLGAWHDAYPAGAVAADADGVEHRVNSRGLPGWNHCAECGRRLPGDALCERHAAALETHFDETRQDPWSA